MSNARELTQALGGQWHGRFGTAPCPVCQSERRKGQNALTLADGEKGLLAHCKKFGCRFGDILAAAGIKPGFQRPCPVKLAKQRAEENAAFKKRTEQARRLWEESAPIIGTLADIYLRHRGITCALPDTLRFHPACWHPTAKRFPALVALVKGVTGFAVHRTYLRADGSGKAEVEPAKAMLGNVKGGAVRLTDGRPGPLVVAEGIETALSLVSGLLPPPVSVWAALSASGIRGLRLPDLPGRLAIAIDNDDGGAGFAAGNALAERAHSLGWAVSLLPAPQGRDWNDVLCTKGGSK